MENTSVAVARRFRGPASSGNGGYVSGIFSAAAGLTSATVTLRVPPPLETRMDVVSNNVAQLTNGSTIVAEAVATDDADLTEVRPVTHGDAQAAESSYAGLDAHPFPECFVCGTARTRPDGLRLLPGRLGDGRTACLWTVTDDIAGRPEFVWAALDCPGGWSAPIEGRPMVLGRMTTQVVATPVTGEQCVVMGELLGTEGRKTSTATTVYGSDGRVLGRAKAVWITLTGPA